MPFQYSTNVIISIHYTFNIFWTVNLVFKKIWINSSIFQIFATASNHNFLQVEATQSQEEVIKKCWVQQLKLLFQTKDSLITPKGTICLQLLEKNILKISHSSMNCIEFCNNICYTRGKSNLVFVVIISWKKLFTAEKDRKLWLAEIPWCHPSFIMTFWSINDLSHIWW